MSGPLAPSYCCNTDLSERGHLGSLNTYMWLLGTLFSGGLMVGLDLGGLFQPK